jgi:hypothetical protein
MTDLPDLPGETEIELAALADGSLAGERREEALARVKGSQALQAALAEQERVIELTAAVDARAPESLHRQIEGMLTPAGRRPSPSRSQQRRSTSRRRLTSRRPGLTRPRVAVAVAALTAVVVAIGLLGRTTHSGPSGLSVQQAAALTLSAATGPAPAENEQHRSQLSVAVGGVSFPYWKERFGWRSSGTRSDELGGHTVRTVFYTNNGGRRIGYAIASGRAPMTSGGKVVRRWGISYRLFSHNGAVVVTWQRGGHLCVMAGRGVSARTLVSLASWDSEKPHAA